MKYWPGSQFNVELWPGSQFNVELWPGSQFNVELWPGVTIQCGIMTPGQNFTLNYDPGHSSTLNCDLNPGSQLNVESWLGVKIQRWIRTWGHNSTWNKDPGSQFNRGSKFYPSGGRNTMTPCLGGRNSTWKIRWILSTARWIKTPRVEIQWGQNSILHRYSTSIGNDHHSITVLVCRRLCLNAFECNDCMSYINVPSYMYDLNMTHTNNPRASAKLECLNKWIT